MRRIAVICAATTVLAGATALAPNALGARRPDASSLGGPAGPRVLICDMTGTDRSAVFSGRMDTIAGAARMQMRFTLLERLGRGADWEKVDVPALRQPHRSAPGVRTFVYKQTVDNLRVGGAYRARVQYRWLTAAGVPLATVTRETPVCRGVLPNLLIAGLDIQPGPTSDTRTYRATISNDGRGDADSVDVLLSVDHTVLDTVTIEQLDSGDSHTVSFTGPACAHAVRVRVDPDNTVGELSEDDNTQLYGC